MNSPTLFSRVKWVLIACFAMLGSLHGQFAIQGPELRLNGFVFAVESDAAGNVYLGGSFNEFNGDDSSGLGLLRLTSGGAKHATWDIGFIDGVSDLLVQGDFLYVAGSFDDVRTLSQGVLNRSHLLRIHLTGANEGKVDMTWVPNVNASVGVLETDGTNLFLGGNFTEVNEVARTRLAKLLIGSGDPDALDGAWNPAPDNNVADLKHAGSWLYVSGGFSSVGGLANNYLARLSLTGTGAADSWAPDVNRPVGDLEASATHLYFGGDFTEIEGINNRSVARYNIAPATPAFDGTWEPDPNGEVSSMALSGSSLYISGVFTTVGAAPRRFMAKVDSGGTGGVDGTFVPEPNGAIQDTKVIGSDLLAGGRFNTTTGAASAGYALLSGTNGSALGSFAGTLSTEGQIYAMQPVTGGMIIGGLFDSVGGVARTSIAKLNSDGTLDAGFNAPIVGYNRLVSDLKLDGSQLYLCGDFLTVGGAPTKHVARVSPTTGAVDAGWFTNPLTPILCIESDANFVYIGSAGLKFIEIAPNNAVLVNNVARLSNGGTATLDQVWKPFIAAENGDPAIASVNDMVIHNGNLIIGGHFLFVVNPSDLGNPYQRLCVAALSTTGWGEPVAGWDTGFYIETEVGSVFDLLLHNGGLYVAGNFLLVDESEYYYIAKLNLTDGSHDLSFDVSPVDSTDFPGPAKVHSLAAQGSHLYVGGSFDLVYTGAPPIGFDPSPYIARVSATTGLLDPTWYPYPDGSVNKMAFAGNNLWVSGSFSEIGGDFAVGPVILAPFSASYQTWLTTWFLPGEIADPDFTAPFWDLDGDGDINLIEAMFNTDPFDPRKSYHTANTGTFGLPLIRRENISGQNYLTVEYTRWKAEANSGITAVPQFGDNLASWPRAGTMVGTATSISTTRERVKYRDTVANPSKIFGRVEVLPQP